MGNSKSKLSDSPDIVSWSEIKKDVGSEEGVEKEADGLDGTYDPTMQIYFIDFEDFKTLGEMPRRPDCSDLLIKAEDIDEANSFIVFISHNWLAGWSGSVWWRDRPHPDTLENCKYRLCKAGIARAKQDLGCDFAKCYVWLDYGCINQDANPAAELKQLDKIVSQCDVIFTPIVDPEHADWEIVDPWRGLTQAYLAKNWREGDHSYLNRAWCRMEMYYAAHIPFSEDKNNEIRIQKCSRSLQLSMRNKTRPHLLYGDREFNKPPFPGSTVGGGVKILEPLKASVLDIFNPMDGSLTVADDRIKIEELMGLLAPHIKPLQVGYTGDFLEGSDGVPTTIKHGVGKYCYEDGKIYLGQWQNNMFHGEGTLTYSNGNIYEGGFVSNQKSGFGVFIQSSKSYRGMWRRNKKHGQGAEYDNIGQEFRSGYWFNHKFGEEMTENDFLVKHEQLMIEEEENAKKVREESSTKQCSFFLSASGCRNGNMCVFKHEHGPDSPNTNREGEGSRGGAAGMSLAQKKMCVFYKTATGCRNGDTCKFSHNNDGDGSVESPVVSDADIVHPADVNLNVNVNDSAFEGGSSGVTPTVATIF